MAKVLGLGGLSFKSPDSAALRAWYTQWLGIESDEHGVNLAPGAMPAGAVTVGSPFAQTTDYVAPSADAFMFNLIVDDLDGALDQVRAGGARVHREHRGLRVRPFRLVHRPGWAQGGAVTAACGPRPQMMRRGPARVSDKGLA